MINEQSYRYLTGEEMKGFGDESAPIDVTRDERCDVNTGKNEYLVYTIADGNISNIHNILLIKIFTWFVFQFLLHLSTTQSAHKLFMTVTAVLLITSTS